MSYWATIGVEPDLSWPREELRVPFKGLQILVLPETETRAPSVALECEGFASLDDTLFTLRQFLSSLAWAEGRGVREIMALGGTQPGGVGRGINAPPFRPPISPRLSIDHVPEPSDERSGLALALFREALALDNIAYRFLGFFKIINVLHRTGSQQSSWINTTLPLLEAGEAQQRTLELQEAGENVGAYLYASGRCAIAHAYNEPLVNPDNPRHRKRLYEDLPLLKALAEYVIEHELGIPSIRTIWRQHLYELEGFRRLVGPELIAALREGEEVSIDALPLLPRLPVRVRHHESMKAFDALQAVVAEVVRGTVHVQCVSDNRCVEAHLGLNFERERLEFDPVFGVTLRDDGTARALLNIVDQVSLIEALYSNGELEVWDADRGERLGLCDPYIPHNADVRATLKNFTASAQAAAELAKQRANSSEPTME
jgi:hypothetical protein